MKALSVLILLLLFFETSIAQNKTFAIGTGTPNSNAALHVESPTGNQGFLMPRLTTAQRNAMAVALGDDDKGMLVYDITTNNIIVWNGTAWGISIAGSSTDALAAVYGTTSGTGPAGFFQNTSAANTAAALQGLTNAAGNGIAIRGDITNAANTSAAVAGNTNGTGVGLYGITTGTGSAIQGYTTTGSSAIYGKHDGTAGIAGKFEIISTGNNSPAVSAFTQGIGVAGEFISINTSNNQAALYSAHNGGGASGSFINFGTGNSGNFIINNPSNSSDALVANTNGTGTAGRFAIANAANSSPVLNISSNGTGNAITANRPIQATSFIGDGSLLTGIVATPGANTVTSGTIVDGTIATVDLANTSVTDTKLASGITVSKLAPGTNGQVLTVFGGATTWQTPGVGGTVTNIITGTGLTGGPISTTGTISIAPGGVGATELANNSITNVKIADGTLLDADINATAAINGTKILPAFGTQNIITSGTITGGSFNGNGSALTGVTATPGGTAGGDLTGTYPNPTLNTGAVTSAKILDGTIGNSDIAAVAAIAGTKITPIFGTQNISTSGSITGASFSGDGSGLTSVALTLPYTASSGLAGNIFNITSTGSGSAIVGVNTATNGSAAFFNNNNVSSTFPAISINHSGTGNAITANRPIQASAFIGDGSALTNLPSNGWSLTGNAGTSPGTNFIGTTDAQALSIKTNGVERMNVSSVGKVGINTTPTNSQFAVVTTIANNAVVASSQFVGAGTNNGLLANAAGATTNNYGVYATGTSNPGGGVGVYGEGVGNGLTVGLYGSGLGTGTTNYGLKADATSAATTNYGVHGSATGATTNWAGYFQSGNVAIQGGLAVGAGNNFGTAGQVLTSAGAGVAPTWAAAGSGWGLTGNTGTVDGTNFIGTTDNIPLTFKVNNQKAGRIDPAGPFFLGIQAGNSNTAIGSTGLGYNALYSNTTGNNNTAIGYAALLSNTTGAGNTATGYQTLFSNITGTENSGYGYAALYANTGSYNTAFGYQALFTNTTGTYNTAIGHTALNANTTGSYNTAVGYDALNINSGFYNTASGFQSLIQNTSGGQNTASGYRSLRSNTVGFSNIAIGYQSLFSNVAGSNATAIGQNAMQYANDTSTPYTNSNVAIGFEALRGSPTASANTGDRNTAVGYQVLINNTTGNLNTATGYLALSSNTIGGQNTANGSQSLGSNVSGTDNSGFGTGALYSNSTGSYNTGMGGQSITFNTTGGWNTGVGYAAINQNTNGNYNTATGVNALFFNTSGSNNTAIGYQSLYGNSTGTNNTAVGYGADVSNTNFTNATVIGYNASVDASNKVRIGNTAITVIQGQVAFTNASDRRLKSGIQEISEGLDFILKLKPVSYLMKNQEDSKLNWGFIAQDIEALVGTENSILTIGGDADRTLGLRYTDFVAPLVKAMQEQQALIETLKKENSKLNVALTDSQNRQAEEIATLKKQMENVMERLGAEAKKN